MKRSFLGLMSMAISLSSFAAPYTPMADYQMSNHGSSDINGFWNSMRTNVRGKDCYRRAHIWSYDLYRYYGVRSSKVFIHYTNKFNDELDFLGKERFGWLARRSYKVKGNLGKRYKNLVKGNKTWDYHVAPVVLSNGTPIVLDRYLDLPYNANYPYTENQAWQLSARPATVDEWVEALTVRGELLWKVRRAEILDQKRDLDKDMRKIEKRMRETSSKSRIERYQRKLLDITQEYAKLQDKMEYLEMDKGDSIDIKCKQVSSIAEVDLNHKSAWCFYSFAPMYYYNELDLRNLAYGYTGYNYAAPPPLEVHTEQNYQNGREYIQRRFNPEELEDAVKELKPTHN